MITSIDEALYELRVIEREGRFIGGLEQHLIQILQQLELEEPALIAYLSASVGSSSSTGQPTHASGDSDLPSKESENPHTPPLHSLLALDPLRNQEVPVQCDGAGESEAVRCWDHCTG